MSKYSSFFKTMDFLDSKPTFASKYFYSLKKNISSVKSDIPYINYLINLINLNDKDVLSTNKLKYGSNFRLTFTYFHIYYHKFCELNTGDFTDKLNEVLIDCFYWLPLDIFKKLVDKNCYLKRTFIEKYVDNFKEYSKDLFQTEYYSYDKFLYLLNIKKTNENDFSADEYRRILYFLTIWDEPEDVKNWLSSIDYDYKEVFNHLKDLPEEENYELSFYEFWEDFFLRGGASEKKLLFLIYEMPKLVEGFPKMAPIDIVCHCSNYLKHDHINKIVYKLDNDTINKNFSHLFFSALSVFNIDLVKYLWKFVKDIEIDIEADIEKYYENEFFENISYGCGNLDIGTFELYNQLRKLGIINNELFFKIIKNTSNCKNKLLKYGLSKDDKFILKINKLIDDFKKFEMTKNIDL